MLIAMKDYLPYFLALSKTVASIYLTKESAENITILRYSTPFQGVLVRYTYTDAKAGLTTRSLPLLAMTRPHQRHDSLGIRARLSSEFTAVMPSHRDGALQLPR